MTFPTARSYTGRQSSREGNICLPRLRSRVYKRLCKDIAKCVNDKDCRKPNEICICNEDCGHLCLNPSKFELLCLSNVHIITRMALIPFVATLRASS